MLQYNLENKQISKSDPIDWREENETLSIEGKSTRVRAPLDIVVHIQSTDLLISVGERAKFTCNFTGEHRVRQEDIAWLKGKTNVTLRTGIRCSLLARRSTARGRCNPCDNIDSAGQCDSDHS